jgi:hypothetical protein
MSPTAISEARMKLDSPQRTFVLGLDFWPNWLLNIFPAAPKAKWIPYQE